MRTKGDIINGAYSRGRISGLTSQPTPEDIKLALRRLEMMAAEFFKRNIDVGYNFEDHPDVNAYHNIEAAYWDAFETNLAVRLLVDFGKQPMPDLKAAQISGFSFLSSSTAQVRQTQYPSRMPRGSGSDLRFNRYNRFFNPQQEAPLSSATNKMIVGDVNNFVEHFDSYLGDTEDVLSYTITADTGLTVVSDSLTTPDVSYQVKATGTTLSNNSLLQVVIVATTSDSRIVTRVIDFELTET